MSPVKRVQKQPPTLPQPLSLPRPRHCLYSQAFPWVAGCWETRSFGFNLDAALEVRVAAQSTTHPIRIADVPQGLTLIQRLWRKGLNCSYTVWAVICLICAACGLLLFVQQQGEEKSTLWTVTLYKGKSCPGFGAPCYAWSGVCRTTSPASLVCPLAVAGFLGNWNVFIFYKPRWILQAGLENKFFSNCR